jgi:GTPase Era involved in 16S rRNA processing
MNINIAIVGCISCGKSTLLNSIFIEQYSHMRIKRDTMVPQVYIESDDRSKKRFSFR